MVTVFKRPLCWLGLALTASSAYVSPYQNCILPWSIPHSSQNNYGSSVVRPRGQTAHWSTKSQHGDIGEIDEDELYMERFRRRWKETRLRQAARQEMLPPNPAFEDPFDFCTTILDKLRRQDGEDGEVSNLGLRVLLRSSTPEWRNVMHRSVGAPLNTDETSVTTALRSTLGRSNNQFNILLYRQIKYVRCQGSFGTGCS
mmetsp:Transcript_20641/g.29942  ORF Transcript_20641/g.29942 Transcript_20641/m.29942 type:complete len:200 (-) Transcript_20641:571-1170(-)